jgi:pyruvate kinase
MPGVALRRQRAPKDVGDLKFGAALGVDLSRSASFRAGRRVARGECGGAGRPEIPLVASSSGPGPSGCSTVFSTSDAVMVARGDLGLNAARTFPRPEEITRQARRRGVLR